MSGTCIVGLGVTGGSLLHALHAAGAPGLSGVDSDPATLAAARAMGFSVAAPDDPVSDRLLADASTIVLGLPIPALAAAAVRCAERADPEALIVHLASLQRPEAIGTAAGAPRILGTHPLAGSHLSGFVNANASLYLGATVHIEERASALQRERAENLWRAAGATTFRYMSATEHDDLMAWVSHLPQLCAIALASSLAGNDVPPGTAGPGARDTTRLAGSSAALWRGILDAAPPATLDALESLEQELHAIHAALRDRDPSALEHIWQRAADWRRRAGEPTS